ncbi:MAG: hypothetical protein L0Y80_09510 [Ignavibacteriae bacterium]|nr:hypothetical protein [Ignavibacteriota bacterium]
MIKADISRFSGAYTTLNAVGRNLDISLQDLARSVMMVGQAGIMDVFHLGFWRLACLLSMTYAHVTEDNSGYLKLSDTFINRLEMSEKISVSYHLGMGFVRASVEILLGVPWLVHTKRMTGVILSPTGVQLPPKVKLYANNKPARIPDLVGFDVARRPHIVEAKGYSSGRNDAELQHAIYQVSQVVSVNNLPPATRIAAFYDMSTDPIQGQIIDPDEEQDSGVKITVEFMDYLRDYYSVFVNQSEWFQARTIERFGRNFKIRAIGTPNLYFGIDSEVLENISERRNPEKAIRFFSDNFLELNASKVKETISVGRDGIILLTQ